MTGLQLWIVDWQRRVLAAVCWALGHSWGTTEWKRSPYTAHTHWRDHRCARCEQEWTECGYFDLRQNPEMFR